MRKKKKSSCSIQSLPTNILVNIFSYFKEEELYKNLSRVCFQWKIATSDASLWKHIKFEGDSMSSHEMTNMLRKAPLLESITLISIPEIIRIIRLICRCNTKVKDLKITNSLSNGEWLPESVLINMLLSCTNLESITIKGIDFSSPRFFELLARKENIKSVNIGLNNILNKNEIMLLAHNRQQLKVLKLSPCSRETPLTDQDIKAVLELLKFTLTSLKLDVVHLGKLTYSAIFKCTKLKELSLKNAITLTVDIFHEIPRSLTCLHTLKIQGATILSNKDFLSIFSSENEVMKQFEHLKITNSRLDDLGLEQILRLCCGTLKCLNVQSCKAITSEICTAVKQCKKLTNLNLAFTSVGTECWIDIIQSLPSLSTVVMDNTINRTILLSQIDYKHLRLEIIILENEFNKNKTIVKY